MTCPNPLNSKWLGHQPEKMTEPDLSPSLSKEGTSQLYLPNPYAIKCTPIEDRNQKTT